MFSSKIVSPNLKHSLLRFISSNTTLRETLPMIPYGLADWREIRIRNGLFVDKTKFIKMIDDGYAHSCIWSPRRTGKTLLCNQMSRIHDKAVDYRERKALFTDTFIDKNPSKCAGRYLVLNLNFSNVSAAEDVRGSFNRYIYSALNNFSKKYVKAGLLKRSVELKEGDFVNNILNLSAAVEYSDQQLSVIVDESDSFVNELMLQKKPEKKDFETSDYYENVKKRGCVLREFGSAVKTASTSGGIARVFMTGVTPLGFSLSSLDTMLNLTHLPSFEGALGMKPCDVEGFLREILKGHPEIDAQVAKHMEVILLSYNGYRTTPDQKEGNLNPQAVWYYLQELQSEGRPPTRLMDPNISQPRADNVASYLVSSFKDAVMTPSVSGDASDFELDPHNHAANMFKPSTSLSALRALAYYHGYMTYADPMSKNKGNLVLPNNVMRKVFIEEVFENLPNAVLEDLAKVSLTILVKKKEENADISAVALGALTDIYVLYQAGNFAEIVKKIEQLKAE